MPVLLTAAYTPSSWRHHVLWPAACHLVPPHPLLPPHPPHLLTLTSGIMFFGLLLSTISELLKQENRNARRAQVGLVLRARARASAGACICLGWHVGHVMTNPRRRPVWGALPHLCNARGDAGLPHQDGGGGGLDGRQHAEPPPAPVDQGLLCRGDIFCSLSCVPPLPLNCCIPSL